MEDVSYRAMTKNDIIKYVEKGTVEPTFRTRNSDLVALDDGCAFLVKESKIYFYGCIEDLPLNNKKELEKVINRTIDMEQYSPSTLLVGCIVPFNDKKNILLLNGDSFNTGLITQYIDNRYPTMSFLALTRLIVDEEKVIGDKDIRAITQDLINGYMQVKDFNADIYETPTQEKIEEAQKFINKNDVNMFQENGYTLLNPFSEPEATWHYPGTVLIHDIEDDGHYLFGQDEGTYFGSELSTSSSSVKQAFKDLIPKHLRNRNDLKRQGEWFIVPVSEKEVPDISEAYQVSTYDQVLSLPREDESSNMHWVSCSNGDSFNCRIGKDGVLYCKNGLMLHPDHEMVEWEGWAKFECNTAIRSVSQEGVD